jgi:hypothetical protein
MVRPARATRGTGIGDALPVVSSSFSYQQGPFDPKEKRMPGRRETLMRDHLRNSAARKRTHKKTQERSQTVAATLRRLEQVEKDEKAATKA